MPRQPRQMRGRARTIRDCRLPIGDLRPRREAARARGLGEELGEEFTQELGEESTQELGEESTQELGEAFTQELGEESTQELGEAFTQESGEESAQEWGQGWRGWGRGVSERPTKELGRLKIGRGRA